MSRFKDIVVCLHSPYEGQHLLNTSALAEITRYDKSNQNSKFLLTASGHFFSFYTRFLGKPNTRKFSHDKEVNSEGI